MRPIVRLFAGAVLAGFCSLPAQADEGLYLRLATGAGHVDNDVLSNVDFEMGFMGSAAVGYSWFFPDSIADLRTELEGTYRYNDTDNLSGNALDGDIVAFTAMANGYLDFQTPWPVVPYLGAGFGVANVSYQDDGAGFITPVDDSGTNLAYQVMGGFNYYLGSNLGFGIEYRFIQSERLRIDNIAGLPIDPKYMHHSVLATVIIGF